MQHKYHVVFESIFSGAGNTNRRAIRSCGFDKNNRLRVPVLLIWQLSGFLA